MPDSSLQDPVDEKLQALEESLAAIARLEVELRKKEDTTQALINASGDRALLLDSEGVIHAANETAAAAMSGSVKDLIGKNVFLILPPEIAKTRKAHHDAVVRTKRPLKYEDIRNNRRLETRLNPILDTDGSVTHVAVFSRDVTEFKAASEALDTHRRNLEKEVKQRTAELEAANARLKAEIEEKRRAEQALFEEKKRLESLIENNSQAIVVLDAHHRILSCNRAFETLFGYREKAIQGEFIDELVAPFEGLQEAAALTHETMSGRAVRRTGRRRRKDESLVEVEIFGVPVIVDGKVTGSYGIYQDISELRRTESALRESESRYRALFEAAERDRDVYRSLLHSSADAIVIYDMEGNARYVSPSFTKIFGWTQEELEGKPILFVPESEKERTILTVRKLIEEGTPVQGFETKRLTKDGRTLDISISASRYHDHEGNPAGILVILRDVTEKKNLEAQLLQAHKMEAIGTLAGGVAHDFNNLLQAISGFTQLLLMGKGPEDSDRGKLEAIENAAQRASELTRRLLIFGRKVEAQLKPVDLNHEVESVCKLLERTIPKMIQIETRLDHPLDLIYADSVQLEQILMNLAINARDAMPEGGKLILETRNTVLDEAFCKKNIGAHPGKYVCFSMGDNGCGMEKRILDRIFEPFFTTKETGKGTGLGLAMVYGIVKNHKGYITCRSTPGKGTQFDVYFPAIVMEKENGADIGADKVREEIQKGTETLLLVDDEAPLREIGKAMLQRFGYTVWEAENGEQAVALYREKKDQVHLVLLDLNMPGMGGYKCHQELLRMDPNVKIVVASGFLEDQRSKRALASGVKAFVEKPYRVNELVTAVRNALDGK